MIQLLHYFYVLSAFVVFISIGIVFSQSIRRNALTVASAKIGLLAHHGMYGGMITCNIFNMAFADTEIKFCMFLIVAVVNFFLYWNFEKLLSVRKYREILKSNP